MKFSILPILIASVFAFPFLMSLRTRKRQLIDQKEAQSIHLLLLAFGLWTGLSIYMGVHGLHVSLMAHVPLLWQATVVVIILAAAFSISPVLRRGLFAVAVGTPQHWLVLFQGLRIGAIGSVLKVLQGEITSAFPLVVGIPDFLFGVSALVLGWLMRRRTVSKRLLLTWNLIGIAIILVPLFSIMPYWMREPGFEFIFEYPMVMAPSIVVPIFISLNGLMAWSIWKDG